MSCNGGAQTETAAHLDLCRLQARMEELQLHRTLHTMFAVLDTNCVIDDLEGVLNLQQVHLYGLVLPENTVQMVDVCVVVPYMVLRELDGLKRDQTDGLRYGVARAGATIAQRAREALRTLQSLVCCHY